MSYLVKSPVVMIPQSANLNSLFFIRSGPIVGRRSADAKPMTKTSKLSADEKRL